MKVKWSPLNKIVLGKKILVFSGLTANIVAFDNLRDFFSTLKQSRSNLILQNKLVKSGILINNSIDDIIKSAQTKSIKYINNKANPFVIIAPTTNCNFHCEYCFVRNSLCNNTMTKSEIDKIIDFIKSQDNKYHVDWFGGEPTLSPDLIKYFYEKAESEGLLNLNSLLSTNGSFSISECYDIINKNINKLQITLDGLKRTHDNRRSFYNSGSFDYILNNLDFLYEKKRKGELKTDIIIRCNIDKITKKEYVQIREFILNKYDNIFNVYPAHIKGKGKILLTNKEFSKFLLTLEDRMGILIRSYLPKETISFKHCGCVSVNAFAFFPNGVLYKCPIDSEFKNREVGSFVKKQFLKNYTIEKNYILSTTEFLPHKCKKCSLLLQCWGGCPQQRVEKNMIALCQYEKYYLGKYISKKYRYDVQSSFLSQYEIQF